MTSSALGVYVDGLEIGGGDSQGKCIRNTAAASNNIKFDYDDPKINFK